MTPWMESRKAMEKMPAESGPWMMGVSATVQVLPALVEWKTRAALPPVANQTLVCAFDGDAGSAGGECAFAFEGGGKYRVRGFQFLPPSAVEINSNCSLPELSATGSPMAMPWSGSRKPCNRKSLWDSCW